MKHTTALFALMAFVCFETFSQSVNPFPPFDGRHWGVVLDHPEMKNVGLKEDVPYLSDAKGTLRLDIYLPPGIKASDKRPAIIFLNAIGDRPGEKKVKSWGIYSSWPRLVAANGFVGISMECDGNRIQESIQGVFSFLNEKGSVYNIDAGRLGVYAASANVSESSVYLMKAEAFKGIKAAVLYYGGVPQGPYRKDLPVFFMVSEGDVNGDRYRNLWNEVLKNKAPWTIKMGSGLPHAFDAFSDNDDARKVIKETLSFWKNYLEPVVAPSWTRSKERDIIEAGYAHDYSRSSALLKAYLAEHPDNTDALAQYAFALKNNHQMEEAQEAFKKRMSSQPYDIDVAIEYASVLYGVDKTAEAESLIAVAVKSGKIEKYMYSTLASSLYYQKKYPVSAQFYEKALAMEPNPIEFYNLACTYAIMGEKEKAFFNLEKALQLGFDSKQQYENDEDLVSLKSDARYKLLLEKLK